VLLSGSGRQSSSKLFDPVEADIFLGRFPLVHHVENFINETVQANESAHSPRLLAPA